MLLATASAQTPAAYPVVESTLYLSQATADVPGFGTVLLMGPDAPQGAAPAGGATPYAPLLDVLGVEDGTLLWMYPDTPTVDLEMVGDVEFTLEYSLTVEAAADRVVRLLAAGPNGELVQLGEARRQTSAPDLLPSTETFHIPTHGQIIPAGHRIALEISIEGTSMLGIITFGNTGSTSAIDRISLRVLDSDHDGVGDTLERILGTDPFHATPTPTWTDTDGDGLPNTVEIGIGTDPANPDTDGDGFGDGTEVAAGSNPNDPNSTPWDRDNDGAPDLLPDALDNGTPSSSPGGPSLTGDLGSNTPDLTGTGPMLGGALAATSLGFAAHALGRTRP